MQMLVMIVGGSVVMGILYDFNTLILASLKRRPRDVIGRTCSFLGHKSLEIYLVHTLILQAILFFIFGGPLG
jgi:peptidoglycan/LPS O-acetylase OafA/YrhL